MTGCNGWPGSSSRTNKQACMLQQHSFTGKSNTCIDSRCIGLRCKCARVCEAVSLFLLVLCRAVLCRAVLQYKEWLDAGGVPKRIREGTPGGPRAF
jgi:hypothetical protein